MALPTWAPVSWETAMLYRQMLVAHGYDKREEEQRLAELPAPCVVSTEKSGTAVESTALSAVTEIMGTHMIVASEGTQLSPGTSGWRYDTSDEQRLRGRPQSRRPSRPVGPESGTLHVSRRITSLLHSARNKINARKKSKPFAVSSKITKAVKAKKTEAGKGAVQAAPQIAHLKDRQPDVPKSEAFKAKVRPLSLCGIRSFYDMECGPFHFGLAVGIRESAQNDNFVAATMHSLLCISQTSTETLIPNMLKCLNIIVNIPDDSVAILMVI